MPKKQFTNSKRDDELSEQHSADANSQNDDDGNRKKSSKSQGKKKKTKKQPVHNESALNDPNGSVVSVAKSLNGTSTVSRIKDEVSRNEDDENASVLDSVAAVDGSMSELSTAPFETSASIQGTSSSHSTSSKHTKKKRKVKKDKSSTNPLLPKVNPPVVETKHIPLAVASSSNKHNRATADINNNEKPCSGRRAGLCGVPTSSVSEEGQTSTHDTNNSKPGATAVGGVYHQTNADDVASQITISEPSMGYRSSPTHGWTPNAILLNDDDIEAEYRDRVRNQIRNEVLDEVREEIVRSVPHAEAVTERNEERERQLSKSFAFCCVSRWKKAFTVSILLLSATIVAITLAVLLPSNNNTKSELSQPTQSDLIIISGQQPTAESSQCQQKCEGWTGRPVIANGADLKRTVLQYLQDPTSSPHGPIINCWDVSNVTDMSYLFRYTTATHSAYDNELDNVLFQSFNESLDCWDVSKVTVMNEMFAHAYNFDQPIGSWDVSKVTDMSFMFNGADKFDKDISSWNVSQVTSMRYMFYGASSFNQDISLWNVSKVQTMSRMFSFAKSFNQDISPWDVSSVKDMRWMFNGAFNFNQDLCAWRLKVNTEEAAMGWMFKDSGCDIPTDWCHVCPAV